MHVSVVHKQTCEGVLAAHAPAFDERISEGDGAVFHVRPIYEVLVIARCAGNLDATRTAVLACLHLADKLRTIQQQLTALRDSMDRRTRSIVEILDQVIPD